MRPWLIRALPVLLAIAACGTSLRAAEPPDKSDWWAELQELLDRAEAPKKEAEPAAPAPKDTPAAVPDVPAIPPGVPLPDVQPPAAEPPAAQLPDLKLPDLKLPDFQLPGVQAPTAQPPAVQPPAVPPPKAQPTQAGSGVEGLLSMFGNAALSNDEARRGLREALSQGIKSAIGFLGREDGFFKNKEVKIPLPGKLAEAEQMLRLMGQGKMVDDFVLRSNRAAEQAVPKVADIFAGSISKMSVEDALAIVKGSPHAATEYFQRTSQDDLRNTILPIVSKTTSEVGATASYKKLTGKAGALTSLTGNALPDLDSFITGKALDALFLMIGREEERIRKDPAARATDLLKKVFGSK